MQESLLIEKIEKARLYMYEAYTNGADYEDTLRISEHLDFLLNKLNNS